MQFVKAFRHSQYCERERLRKQLPTNIIKQLNSLCR